MVAYCVIFFRFTMRPTLPGFLSHLRQFNNCVSYFLGRIGVLQLVCGGPRWLSPKLVGYGVY